MATATKERRSVVKRNINTKRIEIQEEKSTVDALDDAPITIHPEDLEMMFVGKACLNLMKSSVATSNMLSGYKRAYENRVTPETFSRLEELGAQFDTDFERFKRRATSIASTHPLWNRFKDIRGFSAYQLALVMAMMKDISRFEKSSALMVYSGLAAVGGMPVTKANIAKLKEHYFKQGKEFKGFNTLMSGRMFVIVESMLKQKGYFYNMFTRLRERLEARARNEGSVELIDGKEYMKGKKNQSLIMWSMRNAQRRCARTLLQMIWLEWRQLRQLPTRDEYVYDYLGHDKSSFITLDEVLKVDRAITAQRSEERAEAAEKADKKPRIKSKKK
jgi:hypothetical protein